MWIYPVANPRQDSMVGLGFDKTYQRCVYFRMDLMFVLKNLNSVYDMLFMFDFKVENES